MHIPDINNFSFRDFARDDHIALCAHAIAGIRSHLGDRWDLLFRGVDERDPELREARKLVKHLIRVASESTDFYRTVDFITLSAAITVEDARRKNNGKPRAAHLQPSSALTHEHMVPCEAVLMELATAPATTPLKDVLEPLSYRALVCKKKDIKELDRKMKSTLPPVELTRLVRRKDTLAQIPPAFKALMRYDAAGLLEDLLPCSPRAIELKKAYMAWISEGAATP